MIVKHIRVASDLHLEGFPNRTVEELEKSFLPPSEKDKDSILVLAGDICTGPRKLINFLKQIEKRFFNVQYVPGNHEYYWNDYDTWNDEVQFAMSEELTNTTFALGDIKSQSFPIADKTVNLIIGTLWADGGKSLQEQAKVGLYLNDFRLIRKGLRDFSVPDMMEIHLRQKKKLIDFISAAKDEKVVVATHHLPSYSLCHPRFGDECNGGFASDCESIIHEHKPFAWIHGHTHDTIDRMMDKTRIVCNPAGYTGEWNSSFNHYSAKFIDL
jgi:predicted phosphodiesterase